MKLVLVHGRGQPGQNKSGLQRLWLAAMHAGFEAAGVAPPEDLEIVFPYYGDLLFNGTEVAPRAALKMLVERGAGEAAPPAEAQRFAQDIVLEMAQCKGLTMSQLSRDAGGPALERGVENQDVVLAALRLLDRVPGVASTGLELFILDAWWYLSSHALRRQVKLAVQQAIPHDDACVVVAHSLGSIVAYDVLMECVERDRIKAFITLGSPLGIGVIIERLPTTALARRSPEGVGSWFNARDAGDLVALHDVPAVLFKGNPVVTNYSGVHNHGVNQHGIQDYLRDRVVARTLSEALHHPA